MTNVEYKPPIPTYWNKAGVENVADIVAKHFDFSIGDPVEEIVSKQGGSVSYGSKYSDEIEGGAIIASGIDEFHIVISEHTSAKRDRFTIAHELGHLFLHLQKVQENEPSAVMRATRHVDKSDETQQRAEWEANWFAAQLLMPRVDFGACVSKFGPEYAASIFGVSEHAARVRAESI